MKKDCIGPPTIFLGRSVRKVQLHNMTEAWDFSSSQHARATANTVQSHIKKKGLSFPKSCDFPLPTAHRPELDVVLDLRVDDASHYQSLIGVLRWIVELEIVDTCLEVSMMDSCAAFPREGHLEILFIVFARIEK